MRKAIREIRERHERDHRFHSVDRAPDDDPDYVESDDVSFVEWLHVHEDRKTLLDEVHRLYGLMRRRRTRG
jgi:hypothetical protein